MVGKTHSGRLPSFMFFCFHFIGEWPYTDTRGLVFGGDLRAIDLLLLGYLLTNVLIQSSQALIKVEICVYFINAACMVLKRKAKWVLYGRARIHFFLDFCLFFYCIISILIKAYPFKAYPQSKSKASQSGELLILFDG